MRKKRVKFLKSLGFRLKGGKNSTKSELRNLKRLWNRSDGRTKEKIRRGNQ